MIHPYAECDNCGYLLKADDVVGTPPGWGLFSWSVRTGAGLDAQTNSASKLLCSACVSAARKGLRNSLDVAAS